MTARIRCRECGSDKPYYKFQADIEMVCCVACHDKQLETARVLLGVCEKAHEYVLGMTSSRGRKHTALEWLALEVMLQKAIADTRTVV